MFQRAPSDHWALQVSAESKWPQATSRKVQDVKSNIDYFIQFHVVLVGGSFKFIATNGTILFTFIFDPIIQLLLFFFFFFLPPYVSKL